MSQNRHQSYTNEAEGKIKENIKKKKILLYDFFKIKEEQNANNNLSGFAPSRFNICRSMGSHVSTSGVFTDIHVMI